MLDLDQQLQRVGANWKDYSPAWSASTTNPVIKNGNIVGRYAVIGRTILVAVKILMGSTTTYGSGTWQIGLPYKSKQRDDLYMGGSLRAYDFSVTTNYVGIPLTDNVNKGFVQLYTHSAVAPVSSTVPFTWATSDELEVFVTYEVER